MSTSEELSDVVGLLASGDSGILILANAVDSVEAGIVSATFVREVFTQFAAEWKLAPEGVSWEHAWARVCHGLNRPQSHGVGFLRRSSSSERDGKLLTSDWTTLMNAATWSQVHLKSTKSRRGERLLKFPPVDSKSWLADFERTVSAADWFQEPTEAGGAWLGWPLGANCWVSSCELDDGWDVPGADIDGPSGRRVVEALGMWPERDGKFQCYVRYTLDAHAVRRQVAPSQVARPNFADLGNEWFRVRTLSPRASHYAEQGWGTTAHLSVCREMGSDDTGRPEQVVASVPVNAETVRRVQMMFPAADEVVAEKPVKFFHQGLMRGRAATEITECLLKMLDL